MTVGWVARTVRAAVFAAVCVLLAALGHAVMSGHAVPWWVVALGTFFIGAVVWGPAGSERRTSTVVTLTVTAQAGLHAAFSVAQSWADAAESRAFTGAMTEMDSVGSMGASSSMPSMGHDMGGIPSAGMVAGHLLAALLCGVWLAHGERAAFRILRALAGWFVAPLRLAALLLPMTPHRPRVRGRRTGTVRRPRRLLLVHAITSRGPPGHPAVV
ncbi:hypothetical protein [Streptomyces longispororuber]|uniref:hypothetical protein n=1 Tax=Streptomyces longispororuber TaxID=68230 RepID=UPI002109C43F|nr:hypothetical protein [Streptomyces longispororuber]MCQ4211290.1 hypothetical protein [Streptomyces longispororuber]